MSHDQHSQDGGGLRSLLSTQVSDEETMGHRDVIDDAMAWGDRRRRRDRMMATAGAAVAVVAVGVGAATFGASSGGGETAVRPAASSTPSGWSGGGSTQGCNLPNVGWKSTDPKLCGLVTQMQGPYDQFDANVLPIVNAHLPAGVKATAATSDYGMYMILSGPQGTNDASIDVYMQPDAPKLLPPCDSVSVNLSCAHSQVAGGMAETETETAPGGGGAVIRYHLFWIPGTQENYEVNFQVWDKQPANVGMPGFSALPDSRSLNLQTPTTPLTTSTPHQVSGNLPAEPTATNLYLTPDTMAAIIADPAFQTLAGQNHRDTWAIYTQIVARENVLGISNPGMSPTPSPSSSHG
jgi:hypothetical protein